MNDRVIHMAQVRKSYATNLVLDELTLDVAPGVIYGLLGRNGVGKTTTIRALLGLTDVDYGQIHVLGLDSRCQGPEIRAQVGYVAEAQQLYRWMTVQETLWFSSQFYKTWDKALADELLARFELAPAKKVCALSRGMNSKLNLILALAHRPKILFLDEATAGLDAIVRRQFLESIVESVEQHGTTVFVSSHLLQDVERIVEHVAYLESGRIQVCGALDELKQRYRKIRLTFEQDFQGDLPIKGIIAQRRSGRQILVTLRDFTAQTETALRDCGAQLQFLDMSLEDLFAECLVPAAEEE